MSLHHIITPNDLTVNCGTLSSSILIDAQDMTCENASVQNLSANAITDVVNMTLTGDLTADNINAINSVNGDNGVFVSYVNAPSMTASTQVSTVTLQSSNIENSVNINTSTINTTGLASFDSVSVTNNMGAGTISSSGQASLESVAVTNNIGASTLTVTGLSELQEVNATKINMSAQPYLDVLSTSTQALSTGVQTLCNSMWGTPTGNIGFVAGVATIPESGFYMVTYSNTFSFDNGNGQVRLLEVFVNGQLTKTHSCSNVELSGLATSPTMSFIYSFSQNDTLSCYATATFSSAVNMGVSPSEIPYLSIHKLY